MKPHVVGKAGPLLKYLFEHFSDRKKTQVRQMLQHGSVLVNGVAARRHDVKLHPGDKLEFLGKHEAFRENLKPALGLKVLFEDDAVLVVDKPPGLLTMGNDKTKEDTLYWKLTTYVRTGPAGAKGRIFIVHRLDRDASGLLVFAKTETAKRALQEGWDKAVKRYYAIVEGVPEPAEGTIDNHLTEDKKTNRVHTCRRDAPGSQRAITNYRFVRPIGKFSLLDVELLTGRKNQIRVHMAGIDCPISGDEKYGAKTNAFRRLALHAYSLSFTHPVTAERKTFEIPLPSGLSRPH